MESFSEVELEKKKSVSFDIGQHSEEIVYERGLDDEEAMRSTTTSTADVSVYKQRLSTRLKVVVALAFCVVYIYLLVWLSSNHSTVVAGVAFVALLVIVFFVVFVTRTPGKFMQCARGFVDGIPVVGALTRSRKGGTAFNRSSAGLLPE